MPNICVVHLVRKANGIEAFRGFLQSYLEHAAGVDHELLILYKGFSRHADLEPYEALLTNVHHTFMIMADFGYDLRPYFLAAKKSNAEYLCFLNSFSMIVNDDWLLKLYCHITKPGVGIVGATGSWSSITPHGRPRDNAPLWKNLLRPAVRRILTWYFRMSFDGFPNPHLRTNGFMIARTTFLKVRRGVLLTKMQMYRLEGGRQSITKQVERMGLSPVIVGKDGRGYKKQDWAVSRTLWCGAQENLLISDNQTRKYDMGTDEFRKWLEHYAWGNDAAAHRTSPSPCK